MMILLRIADPIDSGVIQDHEVVQQIKAYAETDFLIIDDGLHSSLMESADLITDVKALK
jgi:ATP:corrinoid adenosyltransferase